MVDKKYQVFISSTYKDLIEERRKILNVLLRANCIPAGMELFVATDDEQFKVIKKVIDLCDYYILIIGKCYGSVNPETGLSYTEMEYNYAIEQGIPALVFAIDESIKLPDEKIEHNDENVIALKKFRNKAMSNRLASVWSNSEELIEKCAISIMSAKSEIVRTGWQRATDYDEASLRRTIVDLQTDNDKLKTVLLKDEETIASLMEQSDVAFDECKYKFEYWYINIQKRVDTSKTIELRQIFIIIGLEMNGVSVSQLGIENAIKDYIHCDHVIYFKEGQIINRILLQLKALKLIDSYWNENKSALFWNLTQKGTKTRDDLVLIKNKE
jgi:hypothetical protein